MIGGGVYLNAIPRGEDVSSIVSVGYKNFIASGQCINTKQGTDGLGISFGLSTSPSTLIPFNFTVPIPDRKLPNSKWKRKFYTRL